MAPTKPEAWTGVRDSLAYGPSAPQAAPTAGQSGRTKIAWCSMCSAGDGRQAAGNGVAARRRVLVRLRLGSIIEGTNLAHTGDVVVVTINHRLNVFGFTYLGEAAGSDFALSGGVGMLDIVQALQWVRDNIGRFGGDPNQVTIFGQSGGGRKVATLMAMPGAKGLYHRAIIESGAVLR